VSASFAWSKYFRPHSGIFLAALLFMALNALATGFYAYLVGPVVKFIFTGGFAEGDSLPAFLSHLGLQAEFGNRSAALLILPGLILVAALFKGIGQFGKFYLMGAFGEKALFDIRADMLERMHRLPMERLETEAGGALLSRLSQDSRLIGEAVTNALGSIFSDSMKMLVLLCVAFALDWRLAMITFFLLPLVALPIVQVGRRLKHTAGACQNETAALSAHVLEDIRAARMIRHFGLAGLRAGAFERINRRYLAVSLKSYAIRAFASPLMELIGALGLAVTLAYAAWRMEQGTLVPEHFVSFFASVLLLYEPMKNLGRLNNWIQPGRAGAARVAELLTWKLEDGGGEAQPEGIREGIAIENISFTYGETPVLKGVNLTLQPGMLTALVGPSGSGKSTLLRLLLRERIPTGGSISADGVDISTLSLDAWRRLIAVVEQRPLLFDDTIYNNIALGKPDAGRDEVLEAAGKAGVTRFVADLPQGFETRSGEGGLMLSEGQLQRIALARAFLRRAALVILDEATSALDAESEKIIADAMRELRRGSMLLVVAHRLSTIRNADKIAVLSEGHILEEGTHAELLARHGTYAAFAAMQFGE